MTKDLFGLNIKTPKIKNISLRNELPRKRDIVRATNVFNKAIREPVPVKTRREVLLRAKNKCQYPGCKIKEGRDIKLHIHHKDQVPGNNKPSNLMALCATHHNVIHKKYKVAHKKDLTGRRISSKVVKNKTADKIKQKRKQDIFGFRF